MKKDENGSQNTEKNYINWARLEARLEKQGARLRKNVLRVTEINEYKGGQMRENGGQITQITTAAQQYDKC